MLLAATANTGAVGYQTIFTGTLTSGNLGNAYGYVPSGYGTLTPTNTFTYLGASLTITAITDTIAPTVQSYIVISGWNSNPGYTALYSFQWKGNPEVIYTAGVGGYNYTPGSGGPNVAQWTFSTGSTSFGLVAGIGSSGTLLLRG
jgi:hypothetical protein